MLFTDPAFLFLFLPLVLGLYFALRGHEARNVWLVVASLAFYSTGGGKFVTPMLAMIAGNYALAVAIDRAHVRSPGAARRLLAATVGANLLVLGWYKYADFLAGNANAVAQWWGGTGWPLPGVALPIGISFFTFHAISYVVDVKRGHATAQKNPVHAALYLLLFPQLIAGPIIRYREIADQLAARLVTWNGFAYGVRRFRSASARRCSSPTSWPARATASSPCRPISCRRRSPGWGSPATRCRSTSTSPATPTWRLGWPR